MAELEEIRAAAKSILWMAERYAEGGGSNGPEMRDYRAARAIILDVPLDDDGQEED